MPEAQAQQLSMWQQFRSIWRLMPEFYLGGMDRWLLRIHRPVEIDGQAMCQGGRKIEPWPCPEWVAAEERLQSKGWRLVWR